MWCNIYTFIDEGNLFLVAVITIEKDTLMNCQVVADRTEDSKCA